MDKTKVKISIAFIADGSIKNPILSSQGIPLFEHLGLEGYNSSFITFEREEVSPLDIHFFSLKRSGVKVHPIHIKNFQFIPGWLLFFIIGLKNLIKIIRKNDIHILHTRSFFPTILACIAKIFFFSGIKILFDTRGAFIEEEIYKGHWQADGIKARLFKSIEKRILKISDQIVVVSEWYKSYLVKEYINLNLEEKISVIPNRIKIELKRDFSKKINSHTGVYSGSTAPWQGLSELKLLLNYGLTNHINLSFKLFFYDIQEQKNELSDISNFKNVQIKSANYEDIYEHLSNCNFGILLRANHLVSHASSPIKFAEYLFAGLPVIVNQGIGDTEQIIEKYKVGVIVDNSDYKTALKNMINLLRDPEIYNRCRNTAIKEFNIEDSIKSYIKIYQKLSD